MEIEKFHQILVALNSQDNSTRTEAESILTSFMQSDYLSFLELLVLFMSNSDSPHIRMQCVTYLFKTARRDAPFLTDAVLNFLWPKLRDQYISILLSNIFPPEAKSLFCSIIALCASFTYNSQNSTDIQFFLLSVLESTPQLVLYVASSLTELFIACGSTCGISLEHILTIISSDISSVTNAALFFSVASIEANHSNEELHTIFDQFLSAISQEHISDFLKVLMNFAETSASFFDPHLPDLTNYLISIALNNSLPIERRNYALMCMASIARGAPQMCQVSQDRFLFPVIQCLLSIIAEIDDSIATWSYDPNGTQPYIIAKDTFSALSKSSGNSYFFGYFVHLMNQTFKNKNISWQIIYAFVSELAEFEPNTLLLLVSANNHNSNHNNTNNTNNNNSNSNNNNNRNNNDDNSYYNECNNNYNNGYYNNNYCNNSCYISNNINNINLINNNFNIVFPDSTLPIVHITKQIMAFIENLECHPRIRQAAYNVITQFCRWIGPYFQREAGDLVLPSLKSLIFKETHPITRKSVIICLTAFFSTLTSKGLIDEFDVTFQELINMLNTAPEDLKPLIAKCLGFYANAGDDQFLQYFPIMAETMRSLVCSPNIILQICAIEAFAISCYKISIPEEYTPVCCGFLNIVISILKNPAKKNELTEKQIDSCKSAICVLIGKLGPSFAPFSQEVLPDSLNTASMSIEVTTVGAMDFTYEGLSFLMQIPTSANQQTSLSGVKQFVNKNEACSIAKALEIINAAIVAMKKDFIPYIVPTIKIAKQWLSSEYHIEMIKINACIVLVSCLQVLLSYGQAQQLIDLFVDLYLLNVTSICSQRFLKLLLSMVQRALFTAVYGTMIEPDKIVLIFQTIPSLIELTLERKVKIISGQIQWQTFELSYDKNIDKQDEILNAIADFIKRCLLHQNLRMIMVPFFRQTMLESFYEYIQRPESQILALQVLSEYLIVTSDNANIIQFCSVLFNFASSKNLDLSPIAFDVIGNLFCQFKFGIEEVSQCFLFFKGEMSKNYIVEQDFTLIADHALIALTRIIMCYESELKTFEVLSFWFDMLPIWEASDICDLVYGYLATILEERNEAIFNEDNFERIISLILSNVFSDFMELKTSIRFANFIKAMMNDPIYYENMQNTYMGLKPEHQATFMRLLHYQEQQQENLL